jgi:hypothetical protein
MCLAMEHETTTVYMHFVLSYMLFELLLHHFVLSFMLFELLLHLIMSDQTKCL